MTRTRSAAPTSTARTSDQSFITGRRPTPTASRSTPATSTGRTATARGHDRPRRPRRLEPDQSFITGATAPVTASAVDAGHVYWANGLTRRRDRPRRPRRPEPEPELHHHAAARGRRGRRQSRLLGEQQSGHDRPRRPRRLRTRTRASSPAPAPRTASPSTPATSTGRTTITGTIGRADLDGSDADQSFITGATDPNGVAVDALEPPDTTIDSAKVDRDERRATFRFSSSQPDSSFRCSLDGKAFRNCGSPRTYNGLDRGKHTFKVTARSAQKADDPSPAKESFKI